MHLHNTVKPELTTTAFSDHHLGHYIINQHDHLSTTATNFVSREWSLNKYLTALHLQLLFVHFAVYKADIVYILNCKPGSYRLTFQPIFSIFCQVTQKFKLSYINQFLTYFNIETFGYSTDA